MNDLVIIRDVVTILLVSIPIIYIFKKIGIPSLVGFLLAGIIIGPHGLKLIVSLDEIELMAEIGVMLLLFTIGLEVSLKQLVSMKKFLLVAGGMQVSGTIIISASIFYFFGFELGKSIYFGMLLSLSSTAIVLKILADRKELTSPQGKISLGILIFQDIVIVPMFLLLPVLGTQTGLGPLQLLLKLLIAFGALILILIISKFLMPHILYLLAKMQMRDAFTIGIILVILGTSYITHSLGLSFALGAFIAGLIMAESEYHTQILSDIMPLKDAFNSLFFVSIGLLLDLQAIVDAPFITLVVTLGVIAVKSAVVLLIVLYLRYPIRIGIVTGLGLAQIGEFSFILAQAGFNFNLIERNEYSIFLASSIFTMMFAPLLFKFSERLSFKAADAVQKKVTNTADSLKKLKGHVIIAGYGLNGKNLARVLRETGITYVIADINPDVFRTESEKGEKIFFGDVSKEEILKLLKVETANVIVYVISGPQATKRSLMLAKKLNPSIKAVVRTRAIEEIDDFIKLKADSVIPEEFETSLHIFRTVLEKYHIPLNIIMKQTSLLRKESYSFLRQDEKNISDFVHIDEILAEGLTETFYINPDNPFSGKSLAQINLRANIEATIIAIIRDSKIISNPLGREVLRPHDTLVITGTHKTVDRAIEFLNGEIQ